MNLTGLPLSCYLSSNCHFWPLFLFSQDRGDNSCPPHLDVSKLNENDDRTCQILWCLGASGSFGHLPLLSWGLCKISHSASLSCLDRFSSSAGPYAISLTHIPHQALFQLRASNVVVLTEERAPLPHPVPSARSGGWNHAQMHPGRQGQVIVPFLSAWRFSCCLLLISSLIPL